MDSVSDVASLHSIYVMPYEPLRDIPAIEMSGSGAEAWTTLVHNIEAGHKENRLYNIHMFEHTSALA